MRRQSTQQTQEQKLSKAIHEALSSNRERVVEAAIHFVLADEGVEEEARRALDYATWAFMDVDTIHDVLAEIQPAQEGVIDLDVPVTEPGVIDLDAPDMVGTLVGTASTSLSQLRRRMKAKKAV